MAGRLVRNTSVLSALGAPPLSTHRPLAQRTAAGRLHSTALAFLRLTSGGHDLGRRNADIGRRSAGSSRERVAASTTRTREAGSPFLARTNAMCVNKRAWLTAEN